MEIVLQNNMILIRTGFKTLKSDWMSHFLNQHAQDMLFLPKAVLIFDNEMYRDKKEEFLEALSFEYAANHEFSEKFFLRSLRRYIGQPIKIELIDQQEREVVGVELIAHDSNTVEIALYAPNSWVLSYLHSQLDMYVSSVSATALMIDVSEMKAKSRLERVLNKRHLLHYEIQYRYDQYFMQRLYSDYAEFNFEDENVHEEIDDMRHYYTVLECQIGASQDALKKSYKKLVRVYHPDMVHQDNHDLVNHYTQKFQLLQEAYTALRIVS